MEILVAESNQDNEVFEQQESEAEFSGEEDDEEENAAAKLLPCPTCKTENSITTLPHKCTLSGCTFTFKQGKGGFVLDGFVDDNSDESDVESSSSEEEFISEEDTEDEEDSEDDDEDSEIDSDSDGEWVPKSKKMKKSD